MLEKLSRVERGWKLVGSDGGGVGEVVEVREDLVVVEHGLINKETLYVPVSALADVRDGEVVLDLPADRVAELGWQVPPRASANARPGPRDSGGDTTTMTGAGYGAGGTASAAGPLGTYQGDQIHDRFGGSARAGLGRPEPETALDEEDVASEPAGGEYHDEERGRGA